MMKSLLATILLFCFISCSYNTTSSYPRNNTYSQRGPSNKSNDKPSGPGCFAKSNIPEQIDESYVETTEYTGTDYTDANVALKKYVIEEPSKEWVKKKADGNCLSRNPDDCLVWCLVERKGEVEEFYTVLDTTITDDYKIVKRPKRTFIASAKTDWVQILCHQELNREKISEIQQALMSKGYNIGSDSPSGINDQATKSAVVRYQETNNLPVGQYDVQTMSHLGITYMTY